MGDKNSACQKGCQSDLYGFPVYRNDPKFSDSYAWDNSADPDQRGAV